MPILAGSAYNTVEDVLTRIRTILNDSEVVGGDVITDTAPFSMDLVNAGYEQAQIRLAIAGMETYLTDAWLIALPAITTIDPEARLIVDDTGANIIYPNGVGNVFANTPQLPTDLVLPVRLWERQNGTTQPLGDPMDQPNRGLESCSQGTWLNQWEWKNDGLRFRGATQVQDVKLEYEKHLPKVAAPTDPVPIRGVVNVAAYYAAKIFAASRGGTIAPSCKQEADDEIFMLRTLSSRRRQHKQVRRGPYSGQNRGYRGRLR